MLKRPTLHALFAVVFLVAIACGVRSAHAQDGLSYAPKRLTLPDLVDDLVQCNIRIAPEAVLAAHARYCEAFRAAFAQLDGEHGARIAGSALERSDMIPSTKDVQRSIQEGKASLTLTISLAEGLLDELQQAVSADQRAAFDAFRDECHVRLLMAQVGEAGESYRLGLPQDLGGWIRGSTDARRLSADERRAVAAARLASSAQRRAAFRELLQAVDEARLREAKRADELGIGGMMREAAMDTMNHAPRGAGARPTDWYSELYALGRISPQARARIAAVELEAWRAAAPLLPASARRYSASAFLEVLAGGGEGIGNVGGLPPALTRTYYGGGLDVVRMSLSLPGLSAEQKQALRAAGAEWLDARTAELERLAANAVRAEAPGPPDGAGMSAIDHEHRKKIAAIAKAPWLEADPGQDSTLPRMARGQRERKFTDLPAAEALVLSPEDDAMFPLPGGGSGWYQRGEAGFDDWSARSAGFPPSLPPTVDADAVRMLAATDDQRTVVQAICADFRSEWSAQVQPLQDAAQQDARALQNASRRDSDPQKQQALNAAKMAAVRKAMASRAALWERANTLVSALGEQLSAAVAPDLKSAARVWATQQQLWMLLPRSGWTRNMPNLPAAASAPWFSKKDRVVIMDALAASAASMVALADRARTTKQMADRLDPAFNLEFGEDGVASRGDDPWDRMHRQSLAARDAYLAACAQEAERIAGALGEHDAAAWRRAVLAQRTPFASISLREVIQALDEAPQNQAARAAVLAENDQLNALCDRAYDILSQLPETGEKRNRDMSGPNTPLHARAAVYTDLARDMRAQALWRLRPQLPPAVVERVGIFRQARAIDALGGTQ